MNTEMHCNYLHSSMQADTMTGMVIPLEMSQADFDVDQLLRLGLRATWLRLCLQRTAAVMTPRDRDVITAVATSPHGISEYDLIARLRDLSPGSAHAWIEHLCATWLTRRYVEDIPVIDLPQDDRSWIEARMREGYPTPA